MAKRNKKSKAKTSTKQHQHQKQTVIVNIGSGKRKSAPKSRVYVRATPPSIISRPVEMLYTTPYTNMYSPQQASANQIIPLSAPPVQDFGIADPYPTDDLSKSAGVNQHNQDLNNLLRRRIYQANLLKSAHKEPDLASSISQTGGGFSVSKPSNAGRGGLDDGTTMPTISGTFNVPPPATQVARRPNILPGETTEEYRKRTGFVYSGRSRPWKPPGSPPPK